MNDSHPFIRLDFILLSHTILSDGPNSGNIHSGRTPEAPHGGANDTQHRAIAIKAGVDRSNVTEVLSDHFPVYASWEDSDRPEVELF
jgi:hypothetical protein